MKSFVIFGMGRTGSSLLVSLLNSHPQICCEGELFNLGGWRRPLRPFVRILRHYPMPYLFYRQAYASLWLHKNVYGFKLHTKLAGDQLSDTAGFLHLVERKDWKVIHLKRIFLFDQLLSSLVAGQTKRYFGHNRRPEPAVQVVIPLDTFRTQVERIHAISQKNRQILADIPHLTVTYEKDLAQDTCWPATVARICDYLELPNPPQFESGTTKPWSRPYSDIVVNYAELLADYQTFAGLPPLPNPEK